MSTSSSNPADSTRIIVAALAASAIGALFYNVLPLYLGTAADSKSLNPQQIGLLGTAFFCGFNVAGISSFLWVRRVHWRLMSLGAAPVAALLLYLATQMTGFVPLAAVTAAGGVLFGALLCIGSTMIGDTSNPTRWYGIKNIAESSGGVVLMLVLPSTLIPKYGFNGTVAGMLIWMVLLSTFLFFMPAGFEKPSGNAAAGSSAKAAPRMNPVAFGCALLSFLVFFAGNSAVWAFGERMGNDSGFSQESTGALLSAALVSGIVGSSVIAVLGGRVGNLRLFVITAALGLVSLGFLSAKGSFTAYGIGLCLYMAGWAAGYSVAMAEIAELDVDGRFMALSIGAMGFGAMLGPAAAGWLYEVAGHLEVLVFTSSCIVMSIVLMVVAVRLGRKAP